MSFWVNPNATNTTQYFISKHTQTGGNIFLAGLYNGKDHLSLKGGTVDNDEAATTGYQHWVINVSRVSQTESRIRFIKDNVLVKDTVVAKTMDNIKGRPWLIGQEWDGDTPSDLTKGAIDEVAFFDHNLTWDEITDINTNGVTVNKGKTVEYTYDQGGNITSKREITYDSETGEADADTISYEYGDTNWKDKLTSYDGKSITYDAIGNPLSYDGYSYTWQKGRQLAGINGNGINTGYKYNNDGIRTKKTVNGVTTTYHLEGDQVVYEESYNESDPGTKFNKIYYTYTSDGSLVSMNLDGVEYYYIQNAQNDIIGLSDEAGLQVAAYTYDSWGKLISIKDQNGNDVTDDDTSIGYKNPYRYKGYRYDSGTGLYYLQSRYYNPEWGRFINADAAIGQIGNIQGHNMFQYCFNNPVNMDDPSGHWPKLSTIFTVIAVVAVAVAVVAVVVATAPALAVGGIIGGISAGAAATAATVATGALITAGAAATASVVTSKTEKKAAKPNNTVYALKDGDGTVQYVGRTTDVNKRARAHEKNLARAGLDMVVLQDGLNLAQARAVEQASMIYYHTINTVNKTNNQINGVAPKYWEAYKEVAVGMLDYGWNQVSNEILYWTGN